MLNTELTNLANEQTRLTAAEQKFESSRAKLAFALQDDLGNTTDPIAVVGNASKLLASGKSAPAEYGVVETDAQEIRNAKDAIKAARTKLLLEARNKADEISVSNDPDRVNQLDGLIRQLKKGSPDTDTLVNALTTELATLRTSVVDQVSPVVDNILRADPTKKVGTAVDEAMAQVLTGADPLVRSSLTAKDSAAKFETTRRTALVDLAAEKVKNQIRTGVAIETAILDVIALYKLTQDEGDALRKRYGDLTQTENEVKTKETTLDQERIAKNSKLLVQALGDLIIAGSPPRTRDINLDLGGGITRRRSFRNYAEFSIAITDAQADKAIKTTEVDMIKEAEKRATDTLKIEISSNFTAGVGRFGTMTDAFNNMRQSFSDDLMSGDIYSELTNFTVEVRNKLAKTYEGLALPGTSKTEWGKNTLNKDAKKEAEKRLNSTAISDDNVNYTQLLAEFSEAIKNHRFTNVIGGVNMVDVTAVDAEIKGRKILNWAEESKLLGPSGKLIDALVPAMDEANTKITEMANKSKTEGYLHNLSIASSFEDKVSVIKTVVGDLQSEAWFSPSLAFLARERVKMMQELIKNYEGQMNFDKLRIVGSIAKWGGIIGASAFTGMWALNGLGGIVGDVFGASTSGLVKGVLGGAGIVGLVSGAGALVPKGIEMYKKHKESIHKKKLGEDTVLRAKTAVLRAGEELAKTFTTQKDDKIESALDRMMGSVQTFKFSV